MEGEEEAVEVVDGYTLLRSRNSSSGYAGVYAHHGRFQASHWSGSKNIQVGSYGTAVIAAVARAKYIASEAQGAEEEVEERHS